MVEVNQVVYLSMVSLLMVVALVVLKPLIENVDGVVVVKLVTEMENLLTVQENSQVIVIVGINYVLEVNLRVNCIAIVTINVTEKQEAILIVRPKHWEVTHRTGILEEVLEVITVEKERTEKRVAKEKDS